MLSQKLEAALNEQMNKEIYSAYLYMSMSAYSSHSGLKGFANWFMVQYHEEMSHAMKFYDYIIAQGGRVRLMSIEEPPAEFGTPLDMFEKTLKHEQFVTRCIHDLAALAEAEKDDEARAFLEWYVKEQVEEEENDNKIIARLRPAGDSQEALMAIDSGLAARAYKPPAASTQA